MDGTVNWIDFHGSRNIEACLLEPQRHTTGPGKQVDARGTPFSCAR